MVEGGCESTTIDSGLTQALLSERRQETNLLSSSDPSCRPSNRLSELRSCDRAADVECEGMAYSPYADKEYKDSHHDVYRR